MRPLLGDETNEVPQHAQSVTCFCLGRGTYPLTSGFAALLHWTEQNFLASVLGLNAVPQWAHAFSFSLVFDAAEHASPQ